MDNVQRDEIREISVEEPVLPLDELYFRKAVIWCYVLFNETGPFFRFSAKLLRSNPPASERFGAIKRLVNCARTVHAHNLSLDRKNDQAKRRVYEVWLHENGGAPTDWERCCRCLIGEVAETLSLIYAAYRQRTELNNDRMELWKAYEVEKQRHWEAHEFDLFVQRAADDLGIKGFKCTEFRKSGDRVGKWQTLVSFFDTRRSAEEAIMRAVHVELIGIFGNLS